jgi:hypothetical protein
LLACPRRESNAHQRRSRRRASASWATRACPDPREAAFRTVGGVAQVIPTSEPRRAFRRSRPGDRAAASRPPKCFPTIAHEPFSNGADSNTAQEERLFRPPRRSVSRRSHRIDGDEKAAPPGPGGAAQRWCVTCAANRPPRGPEAHTCHRNRAERRRPHGAAIAVARWWRPAESSRTPSVCAAPCRRD